MTKHKKFAKKNSSPNTPSKKSMPQRIKKLSKRAKIIILALLVLVLVGAITAGTMYLIAEENRTETIEVAETEPVPFTEQFIEDDNLAKGTTQVRQEGVDGVKTKTYEVTKWVHKDQSEISRELVKEKITTEPKPKITANGTYVAPVTPVYQAPAQTPSNSSGSSSQIDWASLVEQCKQRNKDRYFAQNPTIGNYTYNRTVGPTVASACSRDPSFNL